MKSASLRKRLLLALAILPFVVVAAIIGYGLNRYRLIPESYAAWTTGDLMVEYLDTHTNHWPRGWDDLRLAKDSLAQKGLLHMEFDKLPQFVKIDWKADVATLSLAAMNNSNATCNVVTRVNGSKLRTIWGADTEPNTRIMKYIHSLLTGNGLNVERLKFLTEGKGTNMATEGPP